MPDPILGTGVPAVAPLPAPQPGNGAPPPVPGRASDPDHDDDLPARVPSHRVREEADKRRAAEATATKALADLATATATLQARETALLDAQATHAQELHLLGLGFASESVRRFFRREYVAAVAELPKDKRPEFGAWVEAVKGDPLYAVHFEAVGKGRDAKDASAEAATVNTALREIVDGEGTDADKAARIVELLHEAEAEDGAQQPDAMEALVAQVAKRLGVKAKEPDARAALAQRAPVANPNAGTRGTAGKATGTRWTGAAVRELAARNGGRLPQGALEEILEAAESQGLVTGSWRKKKG